VKELVMRSLAVLTLALAALGIVLAISGAAAEEKLKPIHNDAQALEEAVLEAMRAYLREDTAAMRKSFDRMEQSTRRLDREKDRAYGSELITWEQGFHGTIDRGRELSGKGKLEAACDQLMWAQKACVGCHQVARKHGLMQESSEPDAGAGGQPGDGG
jgi:hypothetical protein